MGGEGRGLGVVGVALDVVGGALGGVVFPSKTNVMLIILCPCHC